MFNEQLFIDAIHEMLAQLLTNPDANKIEIAEGLLKDRLMLSRQPIGGFTFAKFLTGAIQEAEISDLGPDHINNICNQLEGLIKHRMGRLEALELVDDVIQVYRDDLIETARYINEQEAYAHAVANAEPVKLTVVK